MAIAHVCIQCGCDMARVRPVREPHYGLRLVFCPQCTCAATRLRHPLWSAWRSYRKLDTAMRIMTLQVLLAVLFCFLGTTAIFSILIGLLNASASPDETDELAWVCAMVFGVLCPAMGAWLTAAYGHLKRWRVWVGWAGVLTLPLLATVFISMLVSELPPPFAHRHGSRAVVEIGVAGLALLVMPGLLVIAGMMIAALAGIPPGKAIAWLMGRMEKSMRRWLRRRRKLARAA